MTSSKASHAPRVCATSDIPTDIVPLRHRGRWLAAAIIAVVASSLIYSAVTNGRFQWPEVWHYLFKAQILAGLRTTLLLTVVAMTLAILLGIVIAGARMSENKVLSLLAEAYLWFFRGTPLLVQLIFWYNLSSLYPHLSIGIPFGGPVIVDANTNQVLSLWVVAIMGLTLNEAAYMAEIVRGGLLSVPDHQAEAASALGMNRWLTFRRIILPQALRIIIPPTGNQVIGMLKWTSLVSVIALADLLYSAQLIYAQNFQTIPLLIVVSIWYLACTTVLTYVQSHVERYYGRGYDGRTSGTPTEMTRRAKIVRRVRRPASAPGEATMEIAEQ